jgi:uncharacterized membrane protein YdjX (TVP38/TMEM64 family)
MKSAQARAGLTRVAEPKGRPSPRLRVGGGAIAAWSAVAALAVGALWFPLGTWVGDLATWARAAGVVGVVAFAVAHVACALLLIPAWPLRVAAGFVYGPAWGFAVASASSFAGAMLAFLAGRRIFRARIARRIAREPRLVALDELIERGGPWIVFLLRVSPLFPNEVVNYGLGATRVRARDYAVASLVGMLPLTATYTWVGSLLTAVGDIASGSPMATGAIGQVLWWSGLAATVAVVLISAPLARRALDRSVGTREPLHVAVPAAKLPDAPRALAIDG